MFWSFVWRKVIAEWTTNHGLLQYDQKSFSDILSYEERHISWCVLVSYLERFSIIWRVVRQNSCEFYFFQSIICCTAEIVGRIMRFKAALAKEWDLQQRYHIPIRRSIFFFLRLFLKYSSDIAFFLVFCNLLQFSLLAFTFNSLSMEHFSTVSIAALLESSPSASLSMVDYITWRLKGCFRLYGFQSMLFDDDRQVFYGAFLAWIGPTAVGAWIKKLARYDGCDVVLHTDAVLGINISLIRSEREAVFWSQLVSVVPHYAGQYSDRPFYIRWIIYHFSLLWPALIMNHFWLKARGECFWRSVPSEGQDTPFINWNCVVITRTRPIIILSPPILYQVCGRTTGVLDFSMP